MATKTEETAFADQQRSLKKLKPNVEALLCYVGIWVSGIIFLVLERKNSYIRFHALQSIFVFGILAIACLILGKIPVAGTGLNSIISITGFILWIILVVKAWRGEMFKMPWVGNLAERLAYETVSPANPQTAANPAVANLPSAPQENHTRTADAEPVETEAEFTTQRESFLEKYYSDGPRNGRLVASAFAIAWSAALLIFFNFYNQYIAYYEALHSGGATTWQMHTLITSDFNIWLSIVTTSLVLTIIGHAVLITFDRYILRQIIQMALDIMGIVSVLALLFIFPFDFSSLPGGVLQDNVTLGLTIGLIFMAVCYGISLLVNLIQLVYHTIRGEY